MSLERSTWQEVLKQTLSQESDYSVAFALATTRADGRPNVRHVGLKDVISLPQSTINSHAASSMDPQPISALLFSTDIRSPKCREIRDNSACALSTWLAETGVQLRIEGNAYLYKPTWTGDGSCKETWILPSSMQCPPYASANLKNMEEVLKGSDLESLSRSLFEGLSPRTRAWHSRGVPGGRITDFTEAEREAWLQELEVGQTAASEAAQNFALLLVVPYEVDVVQIVNQGPDKRWQWKMQDDMTWTVTELVP